jgi:hypothetical protein
MRITRSTVPLLWLYALSLIVLSSDRVGADSTTTSPVSSPPPRSYCVSDQNCLNGGVCRISDADTPVKHCHCPLGVTGYRCEHYCPLLCQNQGHCYTVQQMDAAATFSDYATAPQFACKCLGYFQGDLCEIPYVNCADGSRCLHGGTCRMASNATTTDKQTTNVCDCPAGYQGTSCEQVAPITSHVSSGESFPAAFSNRFQYLLQQKSFSLASLPGAILLLMGILTYLLVCRRRRQQQKQIYSSVSMDMDSITGEINEPKWRNII